MRRDHGLETRLFGAALTTLTRLPWRLGPLPADWLARSAKYFPLVGALVGAIAALVLIVAAQVWPGSIPALFALATALLVTGALHEDGLADVADSAGGRDRESRLAIMKDPRLGPFGALALLVVFGLKVAALASLGTAVAAAALVAAGAVSRLWAVVVMSRSGYAGDRDVAKLDHGIEGPRRRELLLAAALALGPLLLLDLGSASSALALSALAAALVAQPVCRALGGYTGDVLGAVIATSEVAFLLGVAARP